jgi:hypothetical protein
MKANHNSIILPRLFRLLGICLLSLMMAFVLVGCGGSGQESRQEDDHAVGEEHEHSEGEKKSDIEGQAIVPNNGVVVRILAPSDGAAFKQGDEVVVEIETENFPLGEEGRHWHIVVDGAVYAMISGNIKDDVVRGLKPGEHEIAAYLSNGNHEQFEEGASVKITVTE